jgi:hypothetical protein
MDGSGNLVAAWIENGVVMGNTQLFNGSWGTASPVSASGASSLQLVVDQAGNATAIWNQEGTIQSAGLPFNGEWSSPVSLSDEGSSSPQIAVDSSGDIAAIWVSDGVIQSATQPFNEDWPEVPDILSPASPTSDSPQIGIGDGGMIVAIWHSTLRSGLDAIFSNQKILRGDWYPNPGIISDRETSSVHPQITVDSDGNSLGVWYSYTFDGTNYSKVTVQAAVANSLGSWTSPAALSSPGVRNPNDLVLKVSYNPIGLALALWTNCYDYAGFNLEGSVYTPAGWIPPIKFVESNLYLYILVLRSVHRDTPAQRICNTMRHRTRL